MSGLVLELQRDCLDSNIKTSDLLRKALVVATKLDINDIEVWINNELNGYKNEDEAPEYRQFHGEIKYWNHHYRNWYPIIISEPKTNKLLTNRANTQAMAEIELLEDSSKNNKMLHMPIPQEIESFLMKNMDFTAKPYFFINPVHVKGVIDAVRNILLEWTLKLEKDDILGEGMTFSKEEKQTATLTTFNIENMIDSQIQQGNQNSTQQIIQIDIDFETVKNFISEVEKNFSELEVDSISKSDLKADIDTIKSQLCSSNPKSSIRKECLSSMRTILEGAVGGAISSGLLNQIGALLG